MDESLNTTNSQITTTVKATGRLVQYEYVKTCLGVSAVRVFDAASCACAVDRDSYGFVSFTRKCLMYKACKRASVVKPLGLSQNVTHHRVGTVDDPFEEARKPDFGAWDGSSKPLARRGSCGRERVSCV